MLFSTSLPKPMMKMLAICLPLALCLVHGAKAQPGQPSGSVLPGYEPGFQAEYFADTVFGKKVHTRVDQQLYLDYWLDMPAPGIYTDKFSIRWRGRIRPTRTGTYRLYAVADDGIRVWIGGKLAMNEWRLQKANKVLKGAIRLTANKLYDVKAEYFNGKTACYLRLYWAYENEDPVPLDGKYVMTPTTKPAVGQQIVAKANQAKPSEPTASARKVSAPTAPAKKTVVKTQPKAEPKAQPGSPLPDPNVEARKDAQPKAQPAAKEPDTYEDLAKDQVVVIDNLQFEQSSYQLVSDCRQVLDKLANTLQKYPQLRIEVVGHTDNVGNPEHNLRLSRQRAGVVRAYLLGRGIAEARLQTEGHGGSRPLASNTTEAGRQKNRRVEFRVLQAPK
jgi:outer membrane protein OmpA-like peptidoglycan-associated protein